MFYYFEGLHISKTFTYASEALYKYILVQHMKYLWIAVYLWVHLWTEEGKQTHPVSLSEVVLLSISHVQDLVLHHFSIDHYRSGEPEGLIQNTVCRMEKTSK